jgi:hypothetical protein
VGDFKLWGDFAGIYGTQPKWVVEEDESVDHCWHAHRGVCAAGVGGRPRALAATQDDPPGRSVGVHAQNHGLRGRQQLPRIRELPRS